MESTTPVASKPRKPFVIPDWFTDKADPERSNPDFCRYLYNRYLSKPAGDERREYLRSLSEQHGTKRSRPDGVIIEDHPDPDVMVASRSPQLAPNPPIALRPLTAKQQTIKLAIEMQLQMIALSYDADLLDMRAVYRAWLLAQNPQEENEMKDE